MVSEGWFDELGRLEMFLGLGVYRWREYFGVVAFKFMVEESVWKIWYGLGFEFWVKLDWKDIYERFIKDF